MTRQSPSQTSLNQSCKATERMTRRIWPSAQNEAEPQDPEEAPGAGGCGKACARCTRSAG